MLRGAAHPQGQHPDWPNASLSGPLDAKHLKAQLPEDKGTSDLTTGTLTLDGSTKQVTGTSWLGRQWGDWSWDTLHKWTWTAVRPDNGQVLDLWDDGSRETRTSSGSASGSSRSQERRTS